MDDYDRRTEGDSEPAESARDAAERSDRVEESLLEDEEITERREQGKNDRFFSGPRTYRRVCSVREPRRR